VIALGCPLSEEHVYETMHCPLSEECLVYVVIFMYNVYYLRYFRMRCSAHSSAMVNECLFKSLLHPIIQLISSVMDVQSIGSHVQNKTTRIKAADAIPYAVQTATRVTILNTANFTLIAVRSSNLTHVNI
jgi:hypothetical protein